MHLNTATLNTTPNTSGVYVLYQLEDIQYQYDSINIVYIGMSCNLKQRLQSYHYKSAHTLQMQQIINTKILYFRYIKVHYYEELETILLDTFKKQYGSLPYLNRYCS